MQTKSARLLITCPDRPGIVASVAGFFQSKNVNITDLDQHSTEVENGTFFMRLEFQLPGDSNLEPLKQQFQKQVAEPFSMRWDIHSEQTKKRMAILVSKYEHALMELLWRWSSGDLQVDIPFVISNHPDLKNEVEKFGIRFVHIPVEGSNKKESEQKVLQLLKDNCDFVVLARYMQILSGDFLQNCGVRIINIHHSFLPAFVGASPYHQAYQRGVKLVGATAHYVTEELDMGPIIEQDVRRVTHRYSIDDLKNLGKEIEKSVLARAVHYHVEDRIIVFENRTIAFNK